MTRDDTALPAPPPHPYRDRPPRTRWRTVADSPHPLDIDDWYQKKFRISGKRIGTAGSCFAQHIGRELVVLHDDLRNESGKGDIEKTRLANARSDPLVLIFASADQCGMSPHR